ncbi:hypothetical protein D6D17_09512 [Aureobasidium pullulans]|nr:hypothetical protein D6D17_09512 [Aureobasidium pullulans]
MELRMIKQGKTVPYERRNELAKKRRLKFPNPLATFRILSTKEAGFALIYIGIISLCYLFLGAGSTLAAFVRGRIIDSRFRYHAKKQGVHLAPNRDIDLKDFPIERARLEVAVPTLAVGSLSMIGFGWMVQCKGNLAGPLIILFVLGFCINASHNAVAVLLVNIFPGQAGTATAANNLTPCWLGAGATSGVVPMIAKIGIGWTTTFFAAIVIATSPILWYIMVNGPKWRREARERKHNMEEVEAGRKDVSKCEDA